MYSRRTALVRLMACVTLGASGLVVAAQPISGLTYTVNVREYFDVIYAEREAAPSRWLLYTQEPLALKLQLANRTRVGEELATSIPLTEAFVAQWVSAPSEVSSPPVLKIRSTAQVTVSGASYPVDWGDSLILPARAVVTWTVEDIVVPAIPGAYGLQIVPRFSGNMASIIAQSPTILFEVRQPQDRDNLVELARRQLLRAQVRGASPEVLRMALSDLFNLNPNSAFGYKVRAEIAQASGDWQEARSSFAKASELATRGDEIMAAHSSGEYRRQLAASLRQHGAR